MEYVIDSELLILAIEKRPLIWDQNHEFYKHRGRKREAWIEICEIFFDDLDTKEEAEKIFISKQVETKWRHIRDNFTRELRGKTKSGSTPRGKCKRKYIYADKLEFLRPNIEQKFQMDGEVRAESDREPDDYESDESVKVEDRKRAVHRSSHSKRTSKALPFEETMITMEPAAAAAGATAGWRGETASAADEGDDMAFFRSLAPMLATLSTQQKMRFRIDVMQQLMKYHDEKPIIHHDV